MRGIFVIVFFLIGLFCFSISSQDNVDREIDNYMNSYLFQKALSLIDSQQESEILMRKKAICLKNLNKYKEAAVIWQNLVHDYPDDKQYVIELSACYQALANWDKAIQCYDRLIESDSSNVYFRIQRADMYTRQDRYAKALAEYKCIADAYDIENMLRKIALCYDKMNMADSARVYYRKAWDEDFFDTSSLAGLISLNIKGGKSGLPEAINLSNSYIEKDTTNQQINLLNALSFYAADAYEDAVKRFQKCYNNGDSALVVVRSLGLSYYSLGQNDYAYDYLQKAYKMDSTNINVLYALGVVVNGKMEYDTGKKCFGTLLDKVVPADITLYQYYRNMAIAYEGKKEFNEAVDFYKMAVEYANESQKMYLYYTIVSIYDVDMKLPKESLEYYILYKGSLQAYYENLLKTSDPDDTTKGEIAVTRNKLNALDKHINRLQKSLGITGDNNKVKITSTIKIDL